MLLRPNRKVRNPNRKKPTGSISVRWEIYDELDELATTYSMSLGMCVEALLREHKRTVEAEEDS